ncbi:MAG: elongation factor P [Parcubacteria group bacterium Licking1014_1]|nr:MAG: elongation factor P [Parcubacteria group bacterium Licking1014_1]
MLTHTDLRKGAQFIYEGQPWEVLEASAMKMAQRRPVIQSKIKNLIDGRVQEKNFQQGDIFKEADLEKKEIKFLYQNKGQYFFCEINDLSKRFSFAETQIGTQVKYLKPNEIVTGIIFEEKIINFKLPIKVQLKVKESAPGVKGDRAQGGTKSAILESGAEIQVPLFVKEGDIIEINTETGEYVRRV